MVDEVVVLRYGHRAVRDYRVTSHCCLVARAFGAKRIIIAGERDESIKRSIDAVTGKWGGKFKVEFTENWKKTVEQHKKKGFLVVHTTMYGQPLQEKITELRKLKKVLVIVGSQKVERAVYELADYNISVTLQPHSEIASLAVLLDWLFEGKELNKKFENAESKIIPQEKGKKVIKCKK